MDIDTDIETQGFQGFSLCPFEILWGTKTRGERKADPMHNLYDHYRAILISKIETNSHQRRRTF